MNTLTHKGYTAECRKDFNVPSGWPPCWKINRIIRPDGSIILPTTYAGSGASASFRSQYSNMRQVRSKLEDVASWDMMTDTERKSWLSNDDISLF